LDEPWQETPTLALINELLEHVEHHTEIYLVADCRNCYFGWYNSLCCNFSNSFTSCSANNGLFIGVPKKIILTLGKPKFILTKKSWEKFNN
jgi:hypothetical protein